MVARRGAGVEVRRHRHGHAGGDPPAHRRRRLTQIQRGERKTHRHHPGPRHGRETHVGCTLQVIGRRGPHLRCELGAAARGELVGVKLGAEPRGPRRDQEAPGLVHRKGRALDEHVAERRQALAGDQRDQLIGQQAEVGRAIVAKLGRHHVRPEEGRHQPHGLHPREGAVHLEQPELVLAVEPIAALALDRRDAEREHLAQEAGRALYQLGVGRRAGEPHRLRDAAARRRNLQVAPPEDPLLEFVGAPAAEGQMGVAVHQAGDHQAAAGVEPLGTGVGGGQLTPRAYPADRLPFPYERRIGDRVDLALPAFGAAGGELGDVFEELHTAERRLESP